MKRTIRKLRKHVHISSEEDDLVNVSNYRFHSEEDNLSNLFKFTVSPENNNQEEEGDQHHVREERLG